MCVVTKEKNEELYNSLFPEDVETITMTKEDYDRNIKQLLVEKLELEHKYNLMKKNAYQLAMKIDKAIEYNNYFENAVKEELDLKQDYSIIIASYIGVFHDTLEEILNGDDKE